eukprot:1161646-Pelagomonas_calceolata.AAC.1
MLDLRVDGCMHGLGRIQHVYSLCLFWVAYSHEGVVVDLRKRLRDTDILCVAGTVEQAKQPNYLGEGQIPLHNV